jgi:hypothetical protein
MIKWIKISLPPDVRFDLSTDYARWCSTNIGRINIDWTLNQIDWCVAFRNDSDVTAFKLKFGL